MTIRTVINGVPVLAHRSQAAAHDGVSHAVN